MTSTRLNQSENNNKTTINKIDTLKSVAIFYDSTFKLGQFCVYLFFVLNIDCSLSLDWFSTQDKQVEWFMLSKRLCVSKNTSRVSND